MAPDETNVFAVKINWDFPTRPSLSSMDIENKICVSLSVFFFAPLFLTTLAEINEIEKCAVPHVASSSTVYHDM
jgi:hypothetical protein